MGLHPSNSISYSMGSGRVSGSSMQRDASQILSILKKPANWGGLGPLKHQAEQSHSDVPQLDVQHINETMKQNAPEDSKLDKTTAQPRSVFSQTEATQEIPVRRATIPIDSDNLSKMPSESPTQLFDASIGKSDIFNHGVAEIHDSNLEQSTIVVEEFSGFSHPKGNQHLTDAPPCDPSRFGSKEVQKYNAVKDEMSRQMEPEVNA
ncbi:hypothetical protein QJS10_CPB20g01848 [Acorus calamus]|uniref:Uncharacterized protein n=1 Tax=Acorus calamus TaxID=4465 RepID=A0AAV9C8V3_ACOCL|nr:hypothetical protein QJS10_CPB20g01848 [Acorus calamus]